MSEYDDLETRLREALHEEGDAVRPSERLEAIRAEAGPPAGAGGRWLWPLASAAAVAAIALVAWVALRPGQPVIGPVATPATATTAAPSVPPSVPPSVAASSTPRTATTSAEPSSPSPSTGAPTTVKNVPVYLLDALPGRATQWRLVRQFWPLEVPSGADQGKTTVAAALATAIKPPDDPNGFLSAFPSGTTATVTEVAANHVSILLSGPGTAGLSAAQQQVAVQQLVWTATAALGRDVPVEITVATGGPIFATLPGGTYKREPTKTAFTVLAPIWIDSPGPGARVAASSPMVVTGQACVFEGALSWQLASGGATLRTGHVQATSGCPDRGTWQVSLGGLGAGTYRFTAQAFSAENGSLAAQNIVEFTVQ